MYLYNEAVLNVSWYLEGQVVDGRGDPLDTNFKIFWNGMGPPSDQDLPKGWIERMTIMESSRKGSENPSERANDYQFQSNDHPNNVFRINEFVIRENTRWDIVLDLAPYNTMPDEFHVNEDDWLELDLYDYFTDPEGLDLSFVIENSENLNVVHTGGKASGNIKIKNAQPNWYGTGWVKVTATDTGMNETEKNFTVIVDPVNDAPMFTEPLPILTIEEDGWTYYNFTGKVMDVEGDTIELSFPESGDYTTEFNETTMNLTIRPSENYNGMIGIDINLSDGDAWTIETLWVNVTPVNDLPSARVMFSNDTELPMGNYSDGSSSGLMVYEMVLDEDTSADIWIDAEDVDSDEITYGFIEGTVRHGTIEVETYEKVVIVNETTNETGMEEIIVPMNFTYTPDENDFAGDLVKFIVGDREGNTTVWVWFHVLPINDPIEFAPPLEWNVSVDLGTEVTIDLADWITDADGDTPEVTTSSEYISVNGTVLTLLYNDTFEGVSETVTVTVSDGSSHATATILVNINPTGDDDDVDDDDVEPTLGEPTVTGEEDKWVVEVEGSEGQDLWVVVEDGSGNRESYKMTYQDGKYTAEIPKDEAEEGFDYWISDSEDGDPIDNSLRGYLPSLEKEDKDEFPWLIIILVILIFAVLAAVLVLVLRGRGDEEDYEE